MTVIARAFAVVSLVALVSGGCTSSHHGTAAEPTTPAGSTAAVKPTPVERTKPAPTALPSGPLCSAAQGSLVPAEAPFTNTDPSTNTGRLIQPFEYVNEGPPCIQEGFPRVQLYNGQHQLLNIAEVDGDVVIGSAVPARLFLHHDDQASGFNIETPTSGSCETASYVSASFGGGSTPLVAIDYQVCGTLYVTTIFE